MDKQNPYQKGKQVSQAVHLKELYVTMEKYILRTNSIRQTKPQ